MRNKKKNKIEKTLEGKIEGTRKPWVVVMEKRCQQRWHRCKQKLDWAWEREALKEENAAPNSTECGGVWDLVVSGCNHGDSAAKRKGIQPQIFLVKERDWERDIFFNLVYLERRGKNEEEKKIDKDQWHVNSM